MIRSLVLFAHVVGVLALFVGLGLEWIGLDGIQRSTTRAEASPWLRLIAIVPRLFGTALAAIVVSGFYLGARVGVLGNDWMRASYGALLLMAAHPILRLSLHVRVAFGLAILFLMIAKPATGESLLVLALASMVTIATSLTRRPTRSTAVQGYR